MKINDIKALHQMSGEELLKKLVDLQSQIGKLQMNAKVHRLEDLRSVSKLKDDVARVKTVIKTKKLQA